MSPLEYFVVVTGSAAALWIMIRVGFRWGVCDQNKVVAKLLLEVARRVDKSDDTAGVLTGVAHVLLMSDAERQARIEETGRRE